MSQHNYTREQVQLALRAVAGRLSNHDYDEVRQVLGVEYQPELDIRTHEDMEEVETRIYMRAIEILTQVLCDRDEERPAP